MAGEQPLIYNEDEVNNLDIENEVLREVFADEVFPEIRDTPSGLVTLRTD